MLYLWWHAQSVQNFRSFYNIPNKLREKYIRDKLERNLSAFSLSHSLFFFQLDIKSRDKGHVSIYIANTENL